MLLRANGSAAIIETLTSELADFDLPGGGYPVRSIALGPRPVPVSEVHAISQSGSALIAAPSTDYAYAEYGQGELEQLRDAQSTTGTAAGDTAVAYQRQRALDRREGQLVLQPIVNLEIFDVLEFGDLTIHANDQLRRVYGIRWRYDRAAERFEQTVEIGPLGGLTRGRAL